MVLIDHQNPKNGQFLRGHTPLPGGGRPRGSRNKLAEAMIDDLYQEWIKHGIQAITACREERPTDFVKIVAMIVMKATDDPNIDSEKRDAAIEQFIEERRQLALKQIAKMDAEVTLVLPEILEPEKDR